MMPVEQVRARNVTPMIRLSAGSFVLKDVEEVVSTLPVNRTVRIEWHRDTLGDGEVVAWPPRVIQQFSRWARTAIA